MSVSPQGDTAPWLLFVFSLSAKRASQRVEVWRMLRRYGAVGLRSSGYVLPNNAQNLERFEWLARSIRRYKGEASVIHVESIDNLSSQQLADLFLEARGRDYEAIIRELRAHGSLRTSKPGLLSRLRRRFQQVVAIDFFDNPLRSRIERLLASADARDDLPTPSVRHSSRQKKEFQKRLWITRPRPGIDRASSAWLIRRFIDPQARFSFGNVAEKVAGAVPFDMFHKDGFGHRGDHCTFETLCKEFRVSDPKVRVISQMIHDADLGDGKFGHSEGIALDHVLIGWAQQGLSDEELLDRGIELIEGLYRSMR